MKLKQVILTLLVAGGMYAGVSTIGDRLNSTPTNSNNRPGIVQPVYAEEELTLEKIAEEVQNKTVEQILEGSKIEYLNADNLEEKAFNSDNKGFIFVYGEKECSGYPRMGIVVREIKKIFPNLIFFAYKNKGEFTKQDFIYRRTGVDTLPSIVMLSSYDILTKTNYSTNKIIDIFAGAPVKDKTILTLIKELPEYWINSNLIGIAPSDGKLYRFNNSFNYKEVGNFK